MRRWLHPRYCRFRAVLGMALLAWAMLAGGAFARSLPMPSAMNMASMAVSQSAATGCDGMSMQRVATQHGPTQPAGYPVCCQIGCHCLATCTAVLTVPRLAIATPFVRIAASVLVPVRPAQMPAAPPLRPPIT